jgi:hypothetical protein
MAAYLLSTIFKMADTTVEEKGNTACETSTAEQFLIATPTPTTLALLLE